MKRTYRQILGSQLPEFSLLEYLSLSMEDRIKYHIDYYATRLKYTKHSVRRKKIQNELKWYQEQLEYYKYVQKENAQ